LVALPPFLCTSPQRIPNVSSTTVISAILQINAMIAPGCFVITFCIKKNIFHKYYGTSTASRDSRQQAALETFATFPQQQTVFKQRRHH